MTPSIDHSSCRRIRRFGKQLPRILNQSTIIDACDTKTPCSAATHRQLPRRHVIEPRDKFFQLAQGITVQRIVDPPALGAIRHETGIFQDPQVKRQSGLARLKRIRQLADALLAFSQLFQEAKPCLIRKRVEETDRFPPASRSGRCHAIFYISTSVD
jgi:hypothetical protein